MKKFKMVCCLPIFTIGAVVGIVKTCLANGYEWGLEEFFEN